MWRGGKPYSWRLVPPQTDPTKVANDNAAFSQWSENVAR